MEKKYLTISDDVTAGYYYFSEYVICVEVTKQGKSLGSFCSDISQFEEWDEEEVAELVKNHVHQVENAQTYQPDRSHVLNGGMEIKYHQHWEDFYCVEVYEKGKEIGSFCADRASFEEWMEDDQHLSEVVRSQLQR
ncbi:hypothetical protein K8O68_18210 [Salipaludibacillus sp. CUR1]|uniref:Uncharacterized protein n=1 Tax=Salipaludibacillus aurantiacus TaxID=1601833 RepID=A0A1H9PMM6_9BACI|nr:MULTISPECIES: hypothetical protein [Salipaludibacillus]MCE7794317.1 hypothetical protein [Salipaludibacillus sp. CUR1]SER49340.1 hypothetical protein SAMN05518684_101383 [Salipaludibacillus aurantiacus]